MSAQDRAARVGQNRVMEQALDYARHGLEVVPWSLDKKGSNLPGRRWKGIATTDPATIESWERYWRTALIACVVPDGKAVIDVDYPDRLDGYELPSGGAVRVGGRGAQYWVADGGSRRGRLPNGGGEVKHSGVVVLPTPGKKYGWLDGRRPWDEQPAMPAWVEDAEPAPEAADVAEGERHAWLTGKARWLRGVGHTGDRLLAELLARNSQIPEPLPEGEVERIAKWADQSIADDPPMPRARARQPHAEPPARSLEVVGMRELLAKDIAPLRYAVSGLLPEGLALLVAAPKIGKSWLASQACVAVAVGGDILGRRATPGPALYLALEDGERRAQHRARLALERMGVGGWPDGAVLDIAFNAERGDAMVAQVESWLAANPGAVLVVVDVLQKVRPAASGRRNQYELDAEDVGRVLEIAKRHPGLCVLVVHHDRKQEAKDFLDAVSGTHGISGSVDTVLVMRRERHSNQARIEVTGRDVDEETVHATFEDGFWVLDPLGGMTDDEQQAYRLIEQEGALGPSAVGEALGKDRSNAHRLLARMAERGWLRKVGSRFDVHVRVRTDDNADNDDYSDNIDNGDNE